MNSHQELHRSAIKENESIDSKDGSIVKLLNPDGSFSNLPKLNYSRNTSSPKLRNRSWKQNGVRNVQSSSNRSMRDVDYQRMQQRALSFGSSHSSFMGTSPNSQNLSMSPSHSTQYRNVSVRGQDDNAPIRIESDDIIMLTRGNVHPLRESHDLVMNPISSQVSEFQQTPQAQVS